MDKIKKYLQEKILSYYTAIKSNELPAPLKKKCNDSFILGGSIIFFSLLFMIFFSIKGNGVSGLLFPSVIGLIVVLIGMVYKINIVLNGYIEVTGECVLHNTRIKKTVSFLIECEDMYVIVPADKKNVPPIGSNVLVYVSARSSSYDDTHGFRHYNQILGYILN